MARLFISYRHCDPDRAVAEFLRQSLQKQGHNVFVDTTGIKGGADWVEEIHKHIEWCDFLIVLLSEESMNSEMVQGEIRLAHRRRKREKAQGKTQVGPGIIPI